MFKTIKYVFAAIVALAMSSCDKEDIGSTATVNVAGEWMVTIDAADAAGNIVYEDFFGLGNVLFITYNTAANRADEMVVDDLGSFWTFQVKVACDAKERTFGSSSWLDNMAYDSKVMVTDGVVVPNGTLSPSGTPVDAICFNVSFDDDEYPADYGFDHYVVSGYRRTGLAGGTE